MDWLKNNSWAIIIAVVALAGSYSVSNYKITALETRLRQDEKKIDSISGIELTNQITLAEIKKDIEYIKLQISLIPKI